MSYPKFKLVLLFLLSLDVLFYAFWGTLPHFLETLSWLLLLIIYELETLNVKPIVDNIMSIIRNSLIAIIAWCGLMYALDQTWLDVANFALWFVMIIVFELNMRGPESLKQYQQHYELISYSVLGGLIIVAGIWLFSSAWLDAFDAIIWLITLAVIDLDVFKLDKTQTP